MSYENFLDTCRYLLNFTARRDYLLNDLYSSALVSGRLLCLLQLNNLLIRRLLRTLNRDRLRRATRAVGLLKVASSYKFLRVALIRHILPETL